MNYKNKSFINKRKAFTLIELLIVIAIIGILFIVLVSKVDFATDKSKATGVQTDFRSFQLAFEQVAKEHSGFNTFGWDTGDTNGDRVRNSYDKGDTNQNGVQDEGEIFIGSKTYSETWTGIYTLTNPADADDKSAIAALETAINANLDPKLHITIADDLTITMANGAQDPWNTEYHGYYITNAEVDNKDLGAIIIYSNGANNEFGSEHKISNGIVSVSVPGNNKLGKDDYSIAVVYTFVNGYGEVKTQTSGFSNNQATQGNISNNSGTEGTEGTEDPDVTELLEPGLYNAGAIALAENGDVEAAQDMIKTSWADLLAAGIVHVTNGVVYSNVDLNTGGNASSDALDGDLVLPNDGSITSIGDAVGDLASGNIVGNIAFAYCYKLTGITIPKGVTSISDMAFTACSSLTSLTIPNSVTSISLGTFAGCTSLTSVTIPDSVTSIGGSSFYECSNLIDITIADSVTEIAPYAFEKCTMLTTVNISENSQLKTIGNDSFMYCSALKRMDFPDSLVSIGMQAFCHCYSLEEITFGNNLTTISYRAFFNCTSLTKVDLPSSIKFLGSPWESYTSDGGAFQRCTNLTELNIPDNTITILYGATVWGTKMETFTVPEGVTTIDDMAFADCPNLKTIYMPSTLQSISGRELFTGSNKTITIIYNGTMTQWNRISKNVDWDLNYNIVAIECLDGTIKLK